MRRILFADAPGGGELKGAGDERGSGEAGEEAAGFGLAIGVRALGCGSGDDAVVKRAVGGGTGGDVEGGLGEGGVEGIVGLSGGGVDLIGDAVGFGEDGGIAGCAEELEEQGPALLDVDRVGLLCGSEAGVDGGELRVEGCGEAWTVCGGGDDGLELVERGDSGVEYGAARVGFEGDDEVEEVSDGGLAGAGEGPLVAEEADALGCGEGGLGFGDDGVELSGSVLRAVVALVVGVGEEDGYGGVGGQRKGGGGGLEDAADRPGGGFEADGDGPSAA